MNKALEIAIVLTAVDKMNEVIEKSIGKASHKLEKMAHIGSKMTMGGAAMTEFFSETIEAAEKNEIAQNRLAQVYKSMGQNVSEASEQSKKFAETLSMQTGEEHANIMAVQAKIATFHSLSNEAGRASGMMDDVTRAAFDMSATGFGDAAGDAVLLGRALEDPIKGTTALRRSGVMFTESEKEKIKVLVETNKKWEAQRIIMDSVQHKFGGVAAATATPMKKMRASLEEVSASIGEALLPLLNKGLAIIQKYIQPVKEWIENNKKLIKILAGVGVGLIGVGVTLNAMAFAGGTALKAINFVKDAMQAGRIMGILFSQGIGAATLSFKAMDAAAKTNVILLAISLIAGAAMLIYQNWEPISKFFSGVFAEVRKAFTSAWEFIKKWGVLFLGPVGLIIKYWDKIKEFFGILWDSIKGKFMGFMDWFTGIPGRMFQAGKNMLQSLWDGIKSMVNKPIQAIKDMVSKIRDFLPFSPAKVGPLRDLHRVRIIETIADTMKPTPMIKAMKRATSMAIMTTAAVMPAAANNGVQGNNHKAVNLHYTSTVNVNGSASREDFAKELQKHEHKIVKIVEEVNRKNKRKEY